MSGGGSKPCGGRMGTSIRATSVSAEAVSNAERELSGMADKLNGIRKRTIYAVQQYQASEKAVGTLEMKLAKSQKEVMICSDSERYFCFVGIVGKGQRF